ncbi:MAG: T9SS type A sorting domain-containing protein, partial [Bacteroidota bacterium]
AYQAGLIQGSAYYVWDAEAGTSGAYITQHISGPSDFYNLPSGSAFVVNAATAGNLTFNETDKVATGDNLFRTTSGPANRVEFRIYSNHDSIYWDRMFESFEPNAVNGVDNYDGSKATNPSVNFYSLANDGTHLSIDARPFVNNMVIPIGFRTSMPAQTYKMKIQTYALPADHVLYLVDNYLNTVEQMQLGSEYTFSVTSDTLSQGDNRFQLNAMLLDTTTTTNVATTNIKNSNTLNVAITPNPATVQTSIRIEGAQKGNTSVSIMNVSGVEVFNTNLGEISTQSIIVPLQDLAAGIYMVKVTSGTETMTTRLVKQ